MLAQALLDSILAACVAMAGARFFGLGRGGAFFAGVAYAVDFAPASFTAQFMSETLFAGLLFGGFCALASGDESGRFSRFLLAAVLFAAATLTRPIVQALPPFLLVGVWWRRKANGDDGGRIVAGSALLLLAYAAAPLGWALCQKVNGGTFTLSNVAAYNFLLYGNEVACRSRGETCPKRIEDALVARLRAVDASASSPEEKADAMRREGVRLMASDKRQTAWLYAKGILRTLCVSPAETFPFLGFDGREMRFVLRGGWRKDPMQWIFRLGTMGGLLVLWLFAGVGLGGLEDSPMIRRTVWLAAGITFFMILLSAFSSTGRFRIPLEPFLLILAARGMTRVALVAPAASVRWIPRITRATGRQE